MKRYAINYEETYSGTFTVELDDDSTEQDAINELLNNADEYRLGESFRGDVEHVLQRQ